MKLFRKNLLKLLAAVMIILAAFPIFTTSSLAGNLTSMSDTMTRLKVSIASNHTLSFTFTAGTNLIESETLTITFPAAFDTSLIDCGDVDITDDGADEDVQENAGGCTANATEWGASMAADVLTLTAPSTAATYINGSSVVTVEIGTNATADEAGDEQITNPGSSGSNKIDIGGTFGDTGSLAVPIMTEDQVTVSATVDPTVTSALSASTCALGTLSATAINFCSYTNTVSTNASSGYVSTIIEDGNLRDGANDINDETGDADVDQGTEEYGASSNDTVGTQDIVNSTGCDDDGIVEAATSITGTAKVYADSGDGDAGPVSGAVTTICHSASILGSTPAGAYSHIVTHITTATF